MSSAASASCPGRRGNDDADRQQRVHGATTISGGTLQIGGGVLGNGSYGAAISIANGSALVLNSGNNQTFGGVISGSGQLVQQGNNLAVFSGASTFSGGTTISAGTLQVGNGGSTGAGNRNRGQQRHARCRTQRRNRQQQLRPSEPPQRQRRRRLFRRDFYWPSNANTNTGITVLTNGAGLYNLNSSSSTDATALVPRRLASCPTP